MLPPDKQGHKSNAVADVIKGHARGPPGGEANLGTRVSGPHEAQCQLEGADQRQHVCIVARKRCVFWASIRILNSLSD